MNGCGECGMLVDAQEYHPYAACVMYRQLGQAEKVNSNLRAVVLHGVDMERARLKTLLKGVACTCDGQPDAHQDWCAMSE
ncbi:MAG TPA: hypothetical protein VFX97_17075 [Pyrinomonadaceae bacterium]|nr:hypothetical protein [Pyrinomonadaceae bacterium]